MRLTGIRLGTEAGGLARLGLDAPEDRTVVGGVTLDGVDGDGILGLDLEGAPADGPLPLVEVAPVTTAGPHPAGATAVDHVVVLTGDVVGTIEALGTEPRRVDVRDGRRYGFVVAGPALLEFVGPQDVTDQQPRLWGLALTVADLEVAASFLGEAAGDVRTAVQPGRRILTVRHEQLGLRVPTVLLGPRSAS